ncbi:MAG: VCBS repeat-containing protein, partial [Candidatus Marinimicrobia bacterium]|nr:VCBS repeat-containing protein [Candidatus Neomarinimicrobiota bacterium]
DLNADGNMDIITANYSSATMSLLLNTGDGSFAEKKDYTTGSSPYAVHSADMDSDGDMDILVSNYGSHSVSIFSNLYSSADITLSTDSLSFSSTRIGQVNTLQFTLYNEGVDSSLLISDISAGTDIFYPLTSSATILPGDSTTISVVFEPDAMSNFVDTLRIVSNDPGNAEMIMSLSGTGLAVSTVYPAQNEVAAGLSDSIVVNFGVDMDGSTMTSDNIVVQGNMRGRYTGTPTYSDKVMTFIPNEDYFVGEQIQILLSRGIKSAAGDTLQEYFIWEFTAETQGGSGVFRKEADYVTATGPYLVCSSDLDDNGTADIMTANYTSENVSVFFNMDAAVFSAKKDFSSYDHVNSIHSADLNNDGFMDMMVTNYFYRNDVTVFINYGSGTGFSPRYYETPDTYSTSVYSSDLDGDGDLDIITTHNTSNISILFNDGTGIFSNITKYAIASSSSMVRTADLDGDGDLDILTLNAGSDKVSILWNMGDGTFFGNSDYLVGDNPYSVALVDVNNDNDVDIVTANNISNNVSILINNGDGTFADKIDYETGTGPVSVFVSDFDGDGDADIATTNTSPGLSILLNTGNGLFTAKIDYATGFLPNSIYSSDFDNDGDMDIVTASTANNSITILLNTSSFADISLSNNEIKFASLAINETVIDTIIIRNLSGVEDLDMSEISLIGGSPFSIDHSLGSLVAGDSLKVAITFNPTAIGIYSDSLKIVSNDPNRGTVYVALEGTASKYVEGLISTNTTWTKANSPYYVSSSVLVNEDVTLTIEPGVTIQVADDMYVKIKGNLIAEGTENDSIIFTHTGSGSFDKIELTNTASASFDYFVIEYADYGLYVDQVTPTIQNGRFSQCTSYGLYEFTTGIGSDVTNCRFNNNGNGLYYEYRSDFVIDKCEALNNSGSGLYFYYGSEGQIENCTLSNNTNYGIYGQSHDEAEIRDNIISENT